MSEPRQQRPELPFGRRIREALENQRKAKIERRERRRFWLDVFAVAAVIVAAVFAAAQWHVLSGQQAVMQGQLDAMVADQRPWINIKPVSADPIVIDGKNIKIGLEFQLINTGKSPAKRVRYAADLSQGAEGGSIGVQDRACLMANAISEKIPKPTIFPNDDIMQRYSFDYAVIPLKFTFTFHP